MRSHEATSAFRKLISAGTRCHHDNAPFVCRATVLARGGVVGRFAMKRAALSPYSTISPRIPAPGLSDVLYAGPPGRILV